MFYNFFYFFSSRATNALYCTSDFVLPSKSQTTFNLKKKQQNSCFDASLMYYITRYEKTTYFSRFFDLTPKIRLAILALPEV